MKLVKDFIYFLSLLLMIAACTSGLNKEGHSVIMVLDSTYVLDSTISQIDTNLINNNISTKRMKSDSSLVDILLEKFDSIDHKKRIGGHITKYYPNGQEKAIINFNSDYGFHGELITFYPSGSIKRTDLYENDSLVDGQCFDSLGLPVPHFQYLIEPTYDRELLNKCIKFPSDWRGLRMRIEFTLTVRITKDGKMALIRHNSALDPELLRETVGCLNRIKFTPRYVDGIAEDSWMLMFFTYRS
jgi:hypothetical protein